MLNLLTKLFKTKEKQLEYLQPVVEEINRNFEALQGASDDELRAKTRGFQEDIRAYVGEIAGKIEELEAAAADAAKEGDTQRMEAVYEDIEKLKKSRNEAYEEKLNEMLPEAFAVVKETCRRLAQNERLVVTAEDYDRDMAAKKSYVTLDGDKAVWANRWDAAGTEVVWTMVHYDVQLMGGVVLHNGNIAEMATGEGKTLVSTLPSYLNALTGQGVHIVTVNDYLARRDAEWNGPVFEFHGLKVDCIDRHQPQSPGRKAAYKADVIYGTNNEFGFDYLRDNTAPALEYLTQGDLHYAIVDEIDSVLIDDARTPLIISGPVGNRKDDEEFQALKPRIESLYKAQRKLANELLNEAKRLLQNEEDKNARKEAGEKLYRIQRGLPKYTPYIKLVSEQGLKTLVQKTEAKYLENHQKLMPVVDEDLYFSIDEKSNQIELTDMGREHITRADEDADLFVLPNITEVLSDLDADESITDAERAKKKDELTRDYSEKAQRLHSIQQLLKAYTLFEKDVDYIVQEGKVMIVDENTGRVMSGRRYSDGLHQALEAKEDVKIEDPTQTIASVTLQNFFRMYHKLAGMTGTAVTEETEFYEIYKLKVEEIPTNKPIIRDDRNDLIYKTKREKYNAVIEEIDRMTQAGRPVLVGTTSVEVSEAISRLLRMRKVKHNVLNAKQNAREADVVAEAGQPGAVTIATNMAGRGTDIKLGPGVREAGGLAIIGSERHDSRRIDRQLRGRAGRQGDPGSSQFFVSLEDDLMRLFGAERISKVMDFLKVEEGEVLTHSRITKSLDNAQRKVEENNFAQRKKVLEYDDVMNKQREVIYARRRNALYGDKIKIDVEHMRFDVCQSIVEAYAPVGDPEGMQLEALRILGVDPGFTVKDIDAKTPAQLAEELYQKALAAYREKAADTAKRIVENLREQVAAAGVAEVKPGQSLVAPLIEGDKMLQLTVDARQTLDTEGRAVLNIYEKHVALETIDEYWKEHLREMDELRQVVANAQYEQKDPLIIYKKESFDLFQKMLTEIYQEIIQRLHRVVLPQLEIAPQQQQRENTSSTANIDHAEMTRLISEQAASQRRRSPLPQNTTASRESPAERRAKAEAQGEQPKEKAKASANDLMKQMNKQRGAGSRRKPAPRKQK